MSKFTDRFRKSKASVAPTVTFWAAVSPFDSEVERLHQIDLMVDRASPIAGIQGIIDVSVEEQGSEVTEFVAMTIGHAWADLMLVAGNLHQFVTATDTEHPDKVRLFIEGPSGVIFEERVLATVPEAGSKDLLVMKPLYTAETLRDHPELVRQLFPSMDKTDAAFMKLSDDQKRGLIAAAQAAAWLVKQFSAPNTRTLGQIGPDGRLTPVDGSTGPADDRPYDPRSSGGYL